MNTYLRDTSDGTSRELVNKGERLLGVGHDAIAHKKGFLAIYTRDVGGRGVERSGEEYRQEDRR